MNNNAFWHESSARDQRCANQIGQLYNEPEAIKLKAKQASALRKTDPEAAFRVYLDLANAGSVWAMQMAGWCYGSGTGVTEDFWQAQDWYVRAIEAGSWEATLLHAKLLAKHGDYDWSEKVLEGGVQANFIPAFFWLAWYRYKQSKSRKTCREVRPLLEYAAEKGHPGAELKLAQWMINGKFGLREIRPGLRRLSTCTRRFIEEVEAQKKAASETPVEQA